jgi:hypothetical protein
MKLRARFVRLCIAVSFTSAKYDHFSLGLRG